MPRPRGDHPHGKPGGRVSMVVNADHVWLTCRSHAGHTVQLITHLISFLLFSHRRPFFFSCRHAQFWSLEGRNGKSKKGGKAVEMKMRRGRKTGKEKKKENRRKKGKKEEVRRRGRRWEGDKNEKRRWKDKKGEEMSKQKEGGGREEGVPLSESCADTLLLDTLVLAFGSASTLAASSSALYLSHA